VFVSKKPLLDREPVRFRVHGALLWTLARTLILALFAIGAAAWGLREHDRRPPPFYVPRPASSPANDDPETFPAPDLVPSGAAER
jgi:hypothetical protein